MTRLPVQMDYVTDLLLRLLEIPSPTGYTDQIVHFVSEELERLDIPYELTRRGAIRATLFGAAKPPGRALVAHLDTLGAMVKQLKPNGRLELLPIGTWPSRFAEGARVTIFTGEQRKRGTILPLKASGHIFDNQVDTQPSGWQHLEVRIDDRSSSRQDLDRIGIHIGDYVAVDPSPEIVDGFINARHLDDKAGVACLLGAARAVVQAKVELPVNCSLLFTLSEEVGSGASAVLHGDVAEMVAVDNATPGPGQNSTEYGVTVCMMDMSGPFDYHLTHKLIDLCTEHGIPHHRDVFGNYRCDAASALEAGNDIRTALVCFGVDASHGYERTHVDSLRGLSELVMLYMQSPQPRRDRQDLGPIAGFPTQPG
jgi:peptidase M42 family hydrolase